MRFSQLFEDDDLPAIVGGLDTPKKTPTPNSLTRNTTPRIGSPGSNVGAPRPGEPTVGAPGGNSQPPRVGAPGTGGVKDKLSDIEQRMQQWDKMSPEEKAKERLATNKRYRAAMQELRAPYLTKLANHPMFNWIGTAISVGSITKILWQWDQYLTGYEKVEEFGKTLAPCDNSSWDPFDDPYLDVDYENADQTFTVAQAGVLHPEDGTLTNFGGNLNSFDPRNYFDYLKYNPLWYVTQQGWVTRAGQKPSDPTTRYTISRRLASWAFNLIVNALTGTIIASKLIMRLSRMAAVALAGSGVGMPAAIITVLVGGGASWIISLAIDRFMKRKEQWLRPLSNKVGGFLASTISTKAYVNQACQRRNMYLELGGVSQGIEVDDNDPSLELLNLVPEAADPDSQQRPNQMQQLAEIIDDEYAELFNQVCEAVLDDMRKAVASDPEKSQQLEDAMSKAERKAQRMIGDPA